MIDKVNRFLINAFGQKNSQRLFVDFSNDMGGAINNVYKVFDLDTKKPVAIFRIRPDETNFGYEKKLAKEAVIAKIISNKDDGFETIRDLLKKHLEKNSGSVKFPFSSDVLYYENKSEFGGPASLMQYIDGGLVINSENIIDYENMGKALVMIHSIKMPRFYQNFFSVIDQEGLSFKDKYENELRVLLLKTSTFLSKSLINEIESIDFHLKINPYPTLCHGDFYGLNAIVDEDKVKLIDWDNTVIDVRELDFAKIYFWTSLNENGILEHNVTKYNAVVKGYMSTGQPPINPKLMKLMAMQWLLRVINFENSLLSQGKKNKAYFPTSEKYYLPELKKIIEELKS